MLAFVTPEFSNYFFLAALSSDQNIFVIMLEDKLLHVSDTKFVSNIFRWLRNLEQTNDRPITFFFWGVQKVLMLSSLKLHNRPALRSTSWSMICSQRCFSGGMCLYKSLISFLVKYCLCFSSSGVSEYCRCIFLAVSLSANTSECVCLGKMTDGCQFTTSSYSRPVRYVCFHLLL